MVLYHNNRKNNEKPLCRVTLKGTARSVDKQEDSPSPPFKEDDPELGEFEGLVIRLPGLSYCHLNRCD